MNEGVNASGGQNGLFLIEKSQTTKISEKDSKWGFLNSKN